MEYLDFKGLEEYDKYIKKYVKTIKGTSQLTDLENGVYFADGTGKIQWAVLNRTQTVNYYSGDIFLICGRGVTKKFIRIGNYIYSGSTDSEYDEQKRCVQKSEVLVKGNTTPYIPQNDYDPATKQYIDNLVTQLSARLDALESGAK